MWRCVLSAARLRPSALAGARVLGAGVVRAPPLSSAALPTRVPSQPPAALAAASGGLPCRLFASDRTPPGGAPVLEGLIGQPTKRKADKRGGGGGDGGSEEVDRMQWLKENEQEVVESLNKIAKYERAATLWLETVSDSAQEEEQWRTDQLQMGVPEDKLPPPPDPFMPSCMVDEKQRERANRVLKAMQVVIDLRKRLFGETEPGMVSSLLTYASVLRARGDIEQVIGVGRHALALLEQIDQIVERFCEKGGRLRPGVREKMELLRKVSATDGTSKPEREAALEAALGDDAPPPWLDLVVTRKFHPATLHVLCLQIMGQACRMTERVAAADDAFLAAVAKRKKNETLSPPSEWTAAQFEDMEVYAQLLVARAEHVVESGASQHAQAALEDAIDALTRVARCPHALKERLGGLTPAEAYLAMRRRRVLEAHQRSQAFGDADFEKLRSVASSNPTSEGLDAGDAAARGDQDAQENATARPIDSLFHSLVQCHTLLATQCAEEGTPELARPAMKKLEKTTLELYPDDSELVASILDTIGAFYATVEDDEDAERCFRKSIAMLRASEDSKVFSAPVMERLATLLIQRGANEEAIQLLEDAVELQDSIMGTDEVSPQQCIESHMNVAGMIVKVYEDKEIPDGDKERVRNHLTIAVQLARQHMPTVVNIASAAATQLVNQGDGQYALELVTDEIFHLEKQEQRHGGLRPEQEVELAEEHYTRGSVHASMRKYLEAEADYLKCEELLSKHLNEEQYPHHFATMNVSYGMTLAQLNRWDEGEGRINKGLLQMQSFANMNMGAELGEEEQHMIMESCITAARQAIHFYELLVERRPNDMMAVQRLQELRNVLHNATSQVPGDGVQEAAPSAAAPSAANQRDAELLQKLQSKKKKSAKRKGVKRKTKK